MQIEPKKKKKNGMYFKGYRNGKNHIDKWNENC